jgi:hypothetical protein
LFQAIVGSWQIRDLIAEKQMGSIAASDLEKMSKSPLPVGSKLLCLLLHLHQNQQETQLAFFWTDILLPQDIGKPMNPSIDLLKGLPIGPRALECLV